MTSYQILCTSCNVKHSTCATLMTTLGNGQPEVIGDPKFTHDCATKLWHLADVWLPERKTRRRVPPFSDSGFSDALLRVFAVGRCWHITTLQARPYKGAIAVAKVFGDPFWSLTLCDRLQKDVDNHRVIIGLETTQATHTAEVAPDVVTVLKTHVRVMRVMCAAMMKAGGQNCLDRLQQIETLLQKSLTQLDTMDTDFQDEVDEKISTAQAEYTDELDARIDAVRAEYTTEIAELREALERQQTQQREAPALRETLESDTVRLPHCRSRPTSPIY